MIKKEKEALNRKRLLTPPELELVAGGNGKGLYGLTGSGMDIEQMVKAAMLKRSNEYDKRR